MFTKRHYEFLATIAAKAAIEDDNWDVEYHIRRGLSTQPNFDPKKFQEKVRRLVFEVRELVREAGQ